MPVHGTVDQADLRACSRHLIPCVRLPRIAASQSLDDSQMEVPHLFPELFYAAMTQLAKNNLQGMADVLLDSTSADPQGGSHLPLG